MPPLNQYTASGQIRSGPVSPGAEPLDATARAGMRLGATIAGAGQDVSVLLEKRQQEKDNRWVGDSESALNRELIQFQLDNNHLEDFGERYRQFADEKRLEYEKEAPSGKAQQLFRGTMQRVINRDYEQSLVKGEQNRLSNFEIGEAQNDTDRGGKFRAFYDLDPDRAKEDLLREMAQSNARKMATFGETMPKATAIMANRTEVSAVQTAMDVDPQFAREILESAKHINPQQYETLDNQIDRAEKSIAAKGAWKVATAYQSAMDVAQAQGTKAPKVPDVDTLKAVYGDDQGEHIHSQLQAAADTQNASVDFISRNRGINANVAQYNLQKEMRALTPDQGAKARGLEQAKLWVNKQLEIQVKHPVDWLKANQADIALAENNARVAYQEAEQSPEGPQRNVKLQVARAEQDYAIELMKHRQGPAPVGVSPEEAAQFLDLKSTHMVSQAEAVNVARKILSAGPEERVKLANSYRQHYGKFAPDFFSDLATMPEAADRLDTSISQGLGITDPGHQAAYMQAQVGGESLSKLDPKKLSEYTSAVSSHPAFISMSRGWLGEYSQRSPKMASSQEGITRYAVLLASEKNKQGQPITPKEAVDMALKHVVTNENAFSTVNGRVVPMARKIGERVLTEEDAADIGRGMEYLLRQLPPQEIARTYGGRPLFPIAPVGQDEQEFVMRKLWTNGFFVTDKDGTTATLYFQTDGGEVQLRDKGNKPFRIAFDKVLDMVPQYTSEVPGYHGGEGGAIGLAPDVVRKSPRELEQGLGKSEVQKVGKQTVADFNPFSSDSSAAKNIIQNGKLPIETRWNWPTKSPLYAP